MEMRFYSIVYPGYLQLRSQELLDFKFEEKDVRFMLGRHMKPLVIFDAFNEFSSENKKHVEKVKSYELTTQKDGVIHARNGEVKDPFSYQAIMERLPEMRVFYNIRCSHLFFIVKEHSKQLDFDFAERLVDYFIKIYRRTLNDVFIEEYNQVASPFLALESGMCSLRPDGFYNFQTDSVKVLWDRFIKRQLWINTNKDKAFELVQANLISGNKLDDKEIFIKAQEEIYVKKNFKYALLEVFIFIEQILVRVLKQIKMGKGISNQILKNFDKEVGIGYMLNIEIPLVLSNYQEHKELFDNINQIRKKRNNVVHNGEIVSEDEAKFAVENSYKLYNLLKKYIVN